jgi:replication initiator protein
MTEPLSVIKHSAAIHMANTLTVSERKIYNALLYHARPKLARGVDHVIRTSTLETAVGFTPNNRPYLVDLTEGLREKSVRYNIFGKDKRHAEIWRMSSGLLAEVGFTLNNSCCRYSFPNTLVDLLKNPHLYARIDLEIQSRIRGHHTLPLYEFYLDMLGGNRMETQFEFLLSDIKELLDLHDSYPEFKVLNRDIVQRAHREINEKTDINVEVVMHMRSGRKVAGLHLRVVRSTTKMEASDTRSSSVIPDAKEKISTTDLENLLFKVFQSSATVERIFREYDDREYIRGNLEYVCQMHERGLVKNLAAYAMKALQQDYRSTLSSKELKAETRRKANEARIAAYSNSERIERAFAAHRIKEARVRYADLSPEEQLGLQEAFESSKEYQGIRSTLRCKLNPSSPIYAGAFYAFVAYRLCTEPEFQDIGVFKETRYPLIAGITN